MACTHLHTSAKQSADIHRYIHTADKQTDRQTYIPIFVLVTLHRHGGGLGRRPLEIVKKNEVIPSRVVVRIRILQRFVGPRRARVSRVVVRIRILRRFVGPRRAHVLQIC